MKTLGTCEDSLSNNKILKYSRANIVARILSPVCESLEAEEKEVLDRLQSSSLLLARAVAPHGDHLYQQTMSGKDTSR